MKVKIAIQLFAASLFAFTTPAWGQTTNYSGRKIEIYTTAKNTNLRLTDVGSVQLKPAAQPLERESWIFVDPTKQFQTIIGIGGALTDASAETFAQLPKKQQQEFLTA